MGVVTPSWTGASFGQPMVKGCYHCGRMVRDLRDDKDFLDSPVACSICVDSGYKMPPTIEQQQAALDSGGDEAVSKLFKDAGKPVSDQTAPVPNIKNPSDVIVHKGDDKELLDTGKGA